MLLWISLFVALTEIIHSQYIRRYVNIFRQQFIFGKKQFFNRTMTFITQTHTFTNENWKTRDRERETKNKKKKRRRWSRNNKKWMLRIRNVFNRLICAELCVPDVCSGNIFSCTNISYNWIRSVCVSLCIRPIAWLSPLVVGTFKTDEANSSFKSAFFCFVISFFVKAPHDFLFDARKFTVSHKYQWIAVVQLFYWLPSASFQQLRIAHECGKSFA